MDSLEENKKTEDNKNKMVFVMQSFFIYTVKNLVTFLKSKSESFASEKKFEKFAGFEPWTPWLP